MLTLHVGNKAYPVADFAAASARYEQARGTRGASRMPQGRITDERGVDVARVSYNGRVWAPGPWQSGDEPLYDKNGFYGDPQDLPRVNGVPQYPTVGR